MNGENGHFEEPILRLRRRIEELSALPDDAGHRREIEKLREKLDRVSREIYSSLTPWQKTLVARHPARPYTLDYVAALVTDFVELHGDRKASDDPAIVAGFGDFRGRPWPSSDTRRAGTRRRRSGATSACPGPTASARRSG